MWDKLDKFGHHIITQVFFGGFIHWFLYYFCTQLLVVFTVANTFYNGAHQGAIVNWFGHKLGYSNFKNGDHSKNTTPWGYYFDGRIISKQSSLPKIDPNFAKKWYELDFTFQVMRGFNFVHIIRLKPVILKVTQSLIPTIVPAEKDITP